MLHPKLALCMAYRMYGMNKVLLNSFLPLYFHCGSSLIKAAGTFHPASYPDILIYALICAYCTDIQDAHRPGQTLSLLLT